MKHHLEWPCLREGRALKPVTYLRSDFRAVPPGVFSLIDSLRDFKSAEPWPRDHVKLANTIAESDPFTVLLFTESLAQPHWGRKQFMNMRRVKRDSELDVTVFDRFNQELHERMSAYLKDHRDPDDVYLESLIKEYYPKAREILKAVYRERYPRAWRRKWSERLYERPRIKVDQKRRYDMPEPLGLWGSDISQQFYFMNGTKTFGRGCGSGSGSREVHSYFALAFLELQRRGLCIPTYVLVYDKDNRLRFVNAWDLPLILPNDIGSNCDVDHRVIRKLMDGAWKITATRRSDWTGIAEVSVWKDRAPVGVREI